MYYMFNVCMDAHTDTFLLCRRCMQFSRGQESWISNALRFVVLFFSLDTASQQWVSMAPSIK